MATEYLPNIETFKKLAATGNLIPVYRELPADLDTPVSLFLKLGHKTPNFLLESVEGGEKLGRYSFIGVDHFQVLRSSGNKAVITTDGRQRSVSLEKGRDALNLVQELLAQHRPVKVPGLPRFFGGAVGYISYDMVRFFEKLPECSRDELGLPDCIFLFSDTMIIFDHVQHKMKVVSNAYVDGDPENAYRKAISRIESAVSRLSRPLVPKAASDSDTAQAPDIELASNFTRDEFAAAVNRCKEYITAGDAFQVVPSQRLRRKTRAHPFAVYRALRMINPSPYMFYFDFGGFQLIGSSPEMLVKLEEGVAEAHPIAGTRPRGASPEEDEELSAELLADPKERAEHVMLVDLARNDLGRVCQPGSVKVPQYMIIEKYSHVIHIVSAVQGLLKKSEDAFSLFRAAFPAGTLTGAPKIRAMQIITELEDSKRGPYGGAVGYFSFTGNTDTCITIRTIVMIGDTVYLQGGAGIVYDSDPLREYQETLNKTKALARAVEIAEETGYYPEVAVAKDGGCND